MKGLKLSSRPALVFIVAVTLLAFALRMAMLVDVPPGWRDDELINMYALSGELLEGRFPLYFTGASGHEPFFHYLQAGFMALLEHNVLSAHLLSAFLGTLTVPLTFVLIRRHFGFWAAGLTSFALAASFWSLLYSRLALRHISLPPFALATFYLLLFPLARAPGTTQAPRRAWHWALSLGAVMGASLYIYPAARVLPVLLVCFGLYLALFHREIFRRIWAGYALALVVTAILALPLALAITQGSNEAAAQGIGADARLVELAKPIRALREGDPAPLLESIWTTLGMFHATGDPEWLYNIANRPVLNLLVGALAWVGVVLCLFRWRQPRYFFLLLWLGLGLLPTVFSVPPASLSHSILVQTLAYLLPVLVVVQAHRWLVSQAPKSERLVRALAVARYIFPAVVLVLFLSNAVRDLYDYFVVWPRQEMVRFLYRADYRQAAQYLDAHAEITDVAIGSTLLGPWDRLALADDLQRQDVRARLFNPEWSLLLPARPPSTLHEDPEIALMVTAFPALDPTLAGFLGGAPLWEEMGLRRYRAPEELPVPSIRPSTAARFSNGLELVGAEWPQGEPRPGQQTPLWLTWQVTHLLDLPPIPIVANPPPAGVYNGPRLEVFTHLLDGSGTLVTGDDALWVDPTTLLPGDRFLQIHHFTLPLGAPPGPYTLELGLYDPLTGERWAVRGVGGQPATDYVLLPVPEDGS